MNILIVDDQRAIVEGLKKEINWAALSVEKVYTACSAREAKMVMKNFPIQLLLTDIEMPEEDGLSLFKWTKENYPHVEGVFLTSHADFDYALRAIQMGGLEYILQPARYKDVEAVLTKVITIIGRNSKLKHIENTEMLVSVQKDNMLDGLIFKINSGKTESVNQLYKSFSQIFNMKIEETAIYPLLVDLVQWKKAEEAWDEKLVHTVFVNVLEELFQFAGGNVVISTLTDNRYWILLVTEKSKMEPELYRARIEEFYSFVEGNMDFYIGLFPAGEAAQDNFVELIQLLNNRAGENKKQQKGIFWSDIEQESKDSEEDIIILAKDYIDRNLNKNILRADVAQQVHLNEEYFSKLFRQRTGYTFKDYVLMEKINLAKKLLSQSKLSVSIIASKTGYDNFSHFSKMFKKITNFTPQEYRKQHIG